MALEAVVFSEGFCGSCGMAAEGGGGGAWSGSGAHGHGGMEERLPAGLDGSGSYWGGAAVACSASVVIPGFEAQDPDDLGCVSALLPGHGGGGRGDSEIEAVAVVGRHGQCAAAPAGRRKRRRAKSVKNVEEVESQRMTHIAVERNRRKQMNEYLAGLRSLMPASYVQRGDQASIIGGAINYVKELEQLVQSLEAHRHVRLRRQCPVAGDDNDNGNDSSGAAVPFADFFTFPQYSMSARHHAPITPSPAAAAAAATSEADSGNADADTRGSKPSAVADIEVTMVESHASLKVLSRRRPGLLQRVVAGLQGHRLAVLHLNATSAAHMALYSLLLKVEDDCRLSSVEDIATAVHRIVEAIEREEREIN